MYHNREYVGAGGTLYDSDLILHGEQISIFRADLKDSEIQVPTYGFYLPLENCIIGYAHNWQEVVDRLNSMMENCDEWRRIEALVRLKARVNAQK